MKLYGAIDLYSDKSVLALLDEHDQAVYRQRRANEARGVLDAPALNRLVASPTASLDSRLVASGYLGRLHTRKTQDNAALPGRNRW